MKKQGVEERLHVAEAWSKVLFFIVCFLLVLLTVFAVYISNVQRELDYHKKSTYEIHKLQDSINNSPDAGDSLVVYR